MHIIKPPPLSDALLQAIERAEMMHGFIQENTPDSIVFDSNEIALVTGLFVLAAEHHGAILYLLRTGQYDGSAFALMRPLIDACYRAHWVYACAKPKTLERIAAGEDCYPPPRNMAEEVEKKIDTGGFFLSIIPKIDLLHSYTHGGYEQLVRRFATNGDVKPDYTDDEKQGVIGVITAHFNALAMAYLQLIAGDTFSANSSAVSAKYGELFA